MRIPQDIKTQADEIVNQFNVDVIGQTDLFFVPRYKGAYLYLDRKDGGQPSPRGRLEYTGDMNRWNFAIYKYSSERYDADEWFFPGGGHLDGTIQGALQACMEAYP